MLAHDHVTRLKEVENVKLYFILQVREDMKNTSSGFNID